MYWTSYRVQWHLRHACDYTVWKPRQLLASFTSPKRHSQKCEKPHWTLAPVQAMTPLWLGIIMILEQFSKFWHSVRKQCSKWSSAYNRFLDVDLQHTFTLVSIWMQQTSLNQDGIVEGLIGRSGCRRRSPGHTTLIFSISVLLSTASTSVCWFRDWNSARVWSPRCSDGFGHFWRTDHCRLHMTAICQQSRWFCIETVLGALLFILYTTKMSELVNKHGL